MFAALFLVISMVTGFALVLALVPRVMQKKILTVAGEKARNPFFALFPACFLSGTALVTWLTYIVGCLLKNTKHPLGYANAVVMPVCFVIAVVIIRLCKSRVRFRELFKSLKPTTSEMVYFAVSLAASVVLMIASFRVVHGEICIGSPVIEDFAPRFVPGGQLLYIGDTEDKNLYVNEERLTTLHIPITEHSKLPDIVISDNERGWLFLIEVVTSHGPVSPKRVTELEEFTKDCPYGVVYVTAFPNA